MWVWLDDEGGRAPELPGRMAGECARLAQSVGLSACGVSRSRDAAQRLISSEGAKGLERLYSIEAAASISAAGIAGALCVSIVEHKPHLIIFPASVTGSDIAGRVAAKLGCVFLSGCVSMEWQNDSLSVRREIYGQRAHQVLRPSGPPPWVVSLDVCVLHPNDLPGSQMEIENLAGSVVLEDCEIPRETWRLAARDLDVSEADLVLSVGKGVDAENVLPQVYKLAELLDAAVGGSREAVFTHMLDRDRQVGASGKWIAPQVYVALGISGSSYHLMGIKGAKHVAAINIDPNAPMFERAEWVGVADLAGVVSAMISACEADGPASQKKRL